MDNWLTKHAQNGFRDFQGLSITGTIPLRDQLVNELIAEALTNAAKPAPTPAPAPGPDMRPLLTLVKKAQVRTTEGAIVLDFAIGV